MSNPAKDHVPTWRGRPIPLSRDAVEAEIERLIDLLDVIDGDPDLEPDADAEPSFGTALNAAEGYELELEGCADDAEPLLGWTEAQSLTQGYGLGQGKDPAEVAGPLKFDGRGCREANELLRARRMPTVQAELARNPR